MDLAQFFAALFGPSESTPQGLGSVLERGMIGYPQAPKTMPVMGRGPLDMQLAQQPGQVMMPNPFGMGPDYNDAPMLEKGSTDELWRSMNGLRFGPNETSRSGVPYETEPYGVRRY